MAAVIVAGILILLVMSAGLQGCCPTKWAVAPAFTIQEPEKRPVVRIQVIKMVDPVTKQETTVGILSKDQLFLIGKAFEIDDRFIKDALDKIGPKKGGP
jgi:outer membrane lipoprotein SlyB